jgi:hypothetical protein
MSVNDLAKQNVRQHHFCILGGGLYDNLAHIGSGTALGLLKIIDSSLRRVTHIQYESHSETFLHITVYLKKDTRDGFKNFFSKVQ